MTLRTLCVNQIKFRTFLSTNQSVRQQLGFRYSKSLHYKKSFLQNLNEKLFGRYLLLTNVVSSGFLMVVGDAAAQEIQYRRHGATERINLQRMAEMCAVGSLQGPLHHFFYKWVDSILPVVSMGAVFKKIALDQLLMSPTCITLFFYSAGTFEGRTLKECTEEFQSKFFTIYRVDWMVWPFVQFINFYWLHPRYRVIYVNLVTMMYNVFLSYMKHDDVPEIKREINSC